MVQYTVMQTVYLLDSFSEPVPLNDRKKSLWPEKISLCMRESEQWIVGYDTIEHMDVITVFTFSSHPLSNGFNPPNLPLLYSTFMALTGADSHFHLESYEDVSAATQGHEKWLLQLQAGELTLSHLSNINE
ncbi:hypothetical protein [Piscirickettsia litoralis]|uniref:Uncharacterized protein n=1 Tax=Piscirickettsia litoralis TaxID=1891921 RepID=A0ABX2ZZP0_9GAMM|nr:hypothetical protein [Piscirickettsia litoralis]ODN41859.1 hypothetical protein BGC07_01315 [Piscirickettsia litoralis]